MLSQLSVCDVCIGKNKKHFLKRVHPFRVNYNQLGKISKIKKKKRLEKSLKTRNWKLKQTIPLNFQNKMKKIQTSRSEQYLLCQKW